MKLNNNITSALLLVFLSLSFGAFSQTAVKTESGYTFVNHTNKAGKKAKAGESASINLYVFLNDSMVSSTIRDFGGPRELTIPSKEQLQPGVPVPAVFEGLPLMAEGDSATVTQAVDSMMAASIPPEFGKVKEIRYVVTLIDLIDSVEMEKKMLESKAKQAALLAKLPEVERNTQALAKDYAASKLGDKLKTLPSTLQMITHEQGTGKPIVKGENINVHYYGCLPDGKMFDSSMTRGEPIAFQQGVGQMIPGFDEGAGYLNHGGKATLFIPYQLGYGEEGTPDGAIPAKSMLIFYIEVQ
jgi:FKBP-type peptidyl-prolyl cis-trans isomerase FkpA